MSHLSPGLISAYNSLTDKHLAGYFSNSRIRRHLQRAGLITRSGRIVPDKEYRHKLNQRAHQRHVRECLAQAIFHKVLEMERIHQIEIKRKLEEFASRERVHKIKVERSKRYEDNLIPVLSPHPPPGARGFRKQYSGPEGEHSESSESLGSSRPNTAPGKMQRPVRLKPIRSNGTTASLRRSSPYRHHESSNENEPLFNYTMNKESRRRLTAMETSNDISPYRLPVINNFVVTPVPPATKRKERGVKVTPSGGTLRGRRLRPTTAAASGANDPPMLRSSVLQSRVCVNMVYFGKTVHLSHDLTDMRDDVKVFQQHCGGENLCVYKGKLREGESFQFFSRRHRGFPFSLTFFLNGLQVERLSSCCEFKHRKGSRLGGRHGHFGFVIVEGASPCYKCIIAMGLDKKPTPPPKRVREEAGREESVISPKDAPEMETEMTGEEAASHFDCEKSLPQDVECRVTDAHVTVQSRVRDDYEEDFEADDEGPVEEAREKKSPSPSNDTEMQVKEIDASETEDDEKDDDTKSCSGSSCTSSDQGASDDETTQDGREKVEQTAEVDEEETVAPPEEKDEPYPEEAAAAAEAEPGAAKDPDLQDSVGDSTEIDISDTSLPLGQELKQSDDTSGEKEEEEKPEEEGKQEEQGPERAKSVQEKLVEAILKESQCSSEPELSDTSTEEEVEAADKHQGQKIKDVPEQQQNLAEELKCEESFIEAEVVQDQEDTSKPRGQEEDGTEKDLHENIDSTKDELVKLDEDDEKPASEEEERETLEDTGEALHAVSEGNMAAENKASEPEEGTEAKCNDSGAAQKDVESEDKTEADARPDKMGQGPKRSEGDESSVSEPDKKTDETAVSDNAEEEAMTVSETMEMKAEPSEEREALSCEEAPVSVTEERQQRRGEAASPTEVTTEDSSSSAEGSADTTVEKTADISEDSVKDEGSKDGVKNEETEEASKDGNRQEEGLGGEQREGSVETNGGIEKEKSEEERKEAENTGEKEENERDKKEEEGKAESKTEEMIEDTKTESNPERQTNEELADEVAHGEKADESEKDEGSESIENKKDGESEAEEAMIDKINEGEEIQETKSERDEEKGEEAEKEERLKEEQMESEKSKDDKEEVGEGEKQSTITEEPEKNTEDEKASSMNAAESEDVNEAADGNKVSEDTVESEDERKETEGATSNSEGRDVDGENGEISTGVERKGSNDDETEASNQERHDEEAAEQVEDERKTVEEPTEAERAEVKEAESGDDSGKHGDDEAEQDHGTDPSESEARETGDGRKQEESAQKDPEPEIGKREELELTEESTADHMNREQMAQDENGIKPELNIENRDSDNDSKTNEGQAQSSPPTEDGLGLGGTSHTLDESNTTSDKNPASDQQGADGQSREDAEEASKASEEGASVLLKPQDQNEEAPHAEESVAVDKGSPEALAAEDSTDLVTNWVNTHQMSKYFETFVEPLEDLREETPRAEVNSKEETRSTELLQVKTPPEMMKTSDKEENEQIHKVESEEKAEAVESEIASKPCVGEAHEGDAIEDVTQEKEKTEVVELNQMIQTEGNDEESSNGRGRGSEKSREEDKDQKGPTQTQSDVSKTEVESIAGTHHSAASLKAESVTEEQSEEKTSGHDPGNPTETEEAKYLRLASKTDEEDNERPASPGAKEAEESGGRTDEQSREVTEITDFATSKSDDGSQEESRGGGIRLKPSNGSVNGERGDGQPIQDIRRSPSKDKLSLLSVDETRFGSSSYPLLSAARTES